MEEGTEVLQTEDDPSFFHYEDEEKAIIIALPMDILKEIDSSRENPIMLANIMKGLKIEETKEEEKEIIFQFGDRVELKTINFLFVDPKNPAQVQNKENSFIFKEEYYSSKGRKCAIIWNSNIEFITLYENLKLKKMKWNWDKIGKGSSLQDIMGFSDQERIKIEELLNLEIPDLVKEAKKLDDKESCLLVVLMLNRQSEATEQKLMMPKALLHTGSTILEGGRRNNDDTMDDNNDDQDFVID